MSQDSLHSIGVTDGRFQGAVAIIAGRNMQPIQNDNLSPLSVDLFDE
jgi:hypothetical protein